MAIRQLRLDGDPLLRKKSREVTEANDRILTLLDDMVETMYENDGVGLAAPQVGILRRIIVIDVGQGPIRLINPEILERDGSQEGVEGCLSVPNRAGIVIRPNHVKVKYQDENMDEKIIEGTGLLARALCHEIDHLEGVLFTDKMEREIKEDEEE